ncbi:DUF3551 domain-containing protein [Bradyrhizobium erythrophlei]|nr:DUF3551 domain-containing protein [Bradyrhizobium erythrophlei]
MRKRDYRKGAKLMPFKAVGAANASRERGKNASRRDASIRGGFGNRGEIEMRKIVGAAAFVAMVFIALPASAQPSDPYDYPYCLQGKDYNLPGLCQFRSYLECEATASGTFSYCGPNPRFAFAYGWQWRGRRPYRVR